MIHQSALTPISDFIHSSEVATIWQTNGTIHKLKPRSFHKSTLPSTEFIYSVHHWANLTNFHLPMWTMSDTEVYSWVILNDPNISSSASMSIVSWLLWYTWTLTIYFDFIFLNLFFLIWFDFVLFFFQTMKRHMM